MSAMFCHKSSHQLLKDFSLQAALAATFSTALSASSGRVLSGRPIPAKETSHVSGIKHTKIASQRSLKVMFRQVTHHFDVLLQ